MKLSGSRYLSGHISLVKSVTWQYSQASQSNHLSQPRPKTLFLGFGAREKRPGVRRAGTRDDPLRKSAWEASREDEVAFERRLFLIFLPEVAYYATNNSNHGFFFFFLLFSLSFLKVCFHTILNKSKNIVFHINLPPVALYEPLTDFRLQSLATL